MRRQEALHHGLPAETGHQEVGNDEVNRAPVLLGDVQSLESVTGRQDGVAVRLENLLHQRSRACLILDHQDGSGRGRLHGRVRHLQRM